MSETNDAARLEAVARYQPALTPELADAPVGMTAFVHDVFVAGYLAGREVGVPSQDEVTRAVQQAQQEGGGYGLDRDGARRVWYYLTQPADPREGLAREARCCYGKACTTTVVRRAGQWVRTSNGNADISEDDLL